MGNGVAELLDRHRAFWRRERVDRALVTVSRYMPLAPARVSLADGTVVEGGLRLLPEVLDPRAISAIKQSRQEGGRLLLGGSFSVRNPYIRIPWVEAILGCPVWADQQVSGSIWSEPFLKDPNELVKLAPLRDNAWYRKLLEFTRLLVEENDGSYLVSHTLMRGPIDLVGAVLGHTGLCLAIYDSPDALKDLLDVTTEVLLEVARGQQEIIPPFHGGYCTRYGIWAPGTVAYTQCDLSALLSAKTYAELVLPFEEKICRRFDYSLIHLHSGYLHTVDALLDAEFPTTIQIALDTGSTPVTTRDLVPVCKKILERKPLVLEGHMVAADLEYLLESLPPHGLYVGAWLDEAELAGSPVRHVLPTGE